MDCELQSHTGIQNVSKCEWQSSIGRSRSRSFGNTFWYPIGRPSANQDVNWPTNFLDPTPPPTEFNWHSIIGFEHKWVFSYPIRSARLRDSALDPFSGETGRPHVRGPYRSGSHLKLLLYGRLNVAYGILVHTDALNMIRVGGIGTSQSKAVPHRDRIVKTRFFKNI